MQGELLAVQSDLASKRHQLDSVAALLLSKEGELSFAEQCKVLTAEGECAGDLVLLVGTRTHFHVQMTGLIKGMQFSRHLMEGEC
jgi:hypothetical protein